MLENKIVKTLTDKFLTMMSLLQIFILISMFSCDNIYDTPEYLGQEPPGDKPIVFCPGLVSLEGRFEYGITFSPDGEEMAFGILNSDATGGDIYYSQLIDNKWSSPVLAEFIGYDNALVPKYSPDGKTFTFSKSPENQEKPDIWIMNRTSDGWEQATPLPSPVSSEHRESGSGLSMNRNLYFTSNRDQSHPHTGDIYISQPDINGKYTEVKKVGKINSSYDEEGLYISPSEDYMLIQTWKQYNAKHDIYISYRTSDETWSTPEKLDSTINTNNMEVQPLITFDNKFLFFSRMFGDDNSLKESDIYWVSTKKVFNPYVFVQPKDIEVAAGEKLSCNLPLDLFKDIDGNKLSYKASLQDDNELPDWLNFKSKELKLSGVPDSSGEYNIKITATDENSNTGTCNFKIIIANN